MPLCQMCPPFSTSCKVGEPPERLRDYEPLAKTCSSFIIRLFAHPSVLGHGRSPYEALPYFIAVALSQSRLPDINALAALTLLQRLKTRHPNRFFTEVHPAPQCVEAERLFLCAYIAATKVLNDDRYGLQFWVRVGQNKFPREELVLMEKKFLDDLDWRTAIDDVSLATYELILERRKQTYGSKDWDWMKVWDALSSSSDGSESMGSSEFRTTGTETSPASSYCPSTPSDPSISSPVVTAGLLQLQLMESTQNIETLDKRLDELHMKFKSMTTKSPRNTPCGSQKHDSKRYSLKDKLHRAFH